MVIPFHAALQQAQAESHWSPSTMAKLSSTGLSTMYRWLSGESVPDTKTVVLACQVFGIDPGNVIEGRAPKYHKQILSLESLQEIYQAQFAADPMKVDLTFFMTAAVVFHTVTEMEVMCALDIDQNGTATITHKDPAGSGHKMEITPRDGSLVVVVKTKDDTILSTEILSYAAVKTAAEMIS